MYIWRQGYKKRVARQLITALTTEGRAFPDEYSEMKFCQFFNISSLDYARMPLKKIRLWNQMASIENDVKNKLEIKNKIKK